MSKANGGGIALGGLMVTTMFGVVAVAAGLWFGGAYYYSQQRMEVRDRVLATATWSPQRLEREWTADCDAGKMRAEAEALLDPVGAFELGKVDRFQEGATPQRARELSRTLRDMEPAVEAFLAAADCKQNGRLQRHANEQQYSGALISRAVLVDSWIHPERKEDLRKLLWIGRDIQASGGLFEFKEGAIVMDTAAIALQHALATGQLDGELDSLMAQLQTLMATEDSAQLHWRSGARLILVDLLGSDWDSNPPTPIRARAMLESMDEVLASLESMPDMAGQPYPERYDEMKAWVAEHDMSTWDQKFRGFGKAGLQVDGIATLTSTRIRALYLSAALRKYRRARGYCPRELTELSDGGFAEYIPGDPLGDQPFEYDRDSCRVTSAEPALKGNRVSASAIEYP